MNILKSLIAPSLLALSITLPATSAQAQQAPITITADENGNGTLQSFGNSYVMPSSRTTDSGPGGLSNALTYDMLGPPSLVGGDVILSEGIGDTLVVSDVIRFLSASGGFIFYSDITGGADALADIGLPSSFYENRVTLAETGSEGNNGAFYTPTANQPGFVSGFAVTYHFISDSAVPEPATWAMMLLGFGGIGMALRRSKRRAGAVAAIA